MGDDPGLPGSAPAAAAAQVFVADLEELEVDADDAHHLGRALRLRPGEVVVAADGAGCWRLCSYRPGADGLHVLRPEGPVHVDRRPATEVGIAFVPVKGERPEWVVQKLTELGVDRIVVLRSLRAVVHWQAERAVRVVERLRRVSRQAAAQSRRARLPRVDGVWSLAELSASVSPETLVLADPGGPPPVGGLRWLAVGPEGGWDDAERSGYATVGLATGVLRAETAAVAAATLLCSLRDGTVRPR